jgi:hypothetical protein
LAHAKKGKFEIDCHRSAAIIRIRDQDRYTTTAAVLTTK